MGKVSEVVMSLEEADDTSVARNDDSIIELEVAVEKKLHIPADDLEGKSVPLLANGKDELCCAGQQSHCAFVGSTQSSRKLVSAMKGGRKQDSPRSLKLNVSWAPDVYDPPPTSLSHTVKGHQHRHRATKKKDQKHRHKGKSKSPRCTYSEKKRYRHSNTRGIGVESTNLMQSRSSSDFVSSSSLDVLDHPTSDSTRMVSHNRLLPVDDFGIDAVENVKLTTELSVGRGQDSKCGSSFRASLAKMHLSFAEAT